MRLKMHGRSSNRIMTLSVLTCLAVVLVCSFASDPIMAAPIAKDPTAAAQQQLTAERATQVTEETSTQMHSTVSNEVILKPIDGVVEPASLVVTDKPDERNSQSQKQLNMNMKLNSEIGLTAERATQGPEETSKRMHSTVSNEVILKPIDGIVEPAKLVVTDKPDDRNSQSQKQLNMNMKLNSESGLTTEPPIEVTGTTSKQRYTTVSDEMILQPINRVLEPAKLVVTSNPAESNFQTSKQLNINKKLNSKTGVSELVLNPDKSVEVKPTELVTSVLTTSATRSPNEATSSKVNIPDSTNASKLSIQNRAAAESQLGHGILPQSGVHNSLDIQNSNIPLILPRAIRQPSAHNGRLELHPDQRGPHDSHPLERHLAFHIQNQPLEHPVAHPPVHPLMYPDARHSELTHLQISHPMIIRHGFPDFRGSHHNFVNPPPHSGEHFTFNNAIHPDNDIRAPGLHHLRDLDHGNANHWNMDIGHPENRNAQVLNGPSNSARNGPPNGLPTGPLNGLPNGPHNSPPNGPQNELPNGAQNRPLNGTPSGSPINSPNGSPIGHAGHGPLMPTSLHVGGYSDLPSETVNNHVNASSLNIKSTSNEEMTPLQFEILLEKLNGFLRCVYLNRENCAENLETIKKALPMLNHLFKSGYHHMENKEQTHDADERQTDKNLHYHDASMPPKHPFMPPMHPRPDHPFHMNSIPFEVRQRYLGEHFRHAFEIPQRRGDLFFEPLFHNERHDEPLLFAPEHAFPVVFLPSKDNHDANSSSTKVKEHDESSTKNSIASPASLKMTDSSDEAESTKSKISKDGQSESTQKSTVAHSDSENEVLTSDDTRHVAEMPKEFASVAKSQPSSKETVYSPAESSISSKYWAMYPAPLHQSTKYQMEEPAIFPFLNKPLPYLLGPQGLPYFGPHKSNQFPIPRIDFGGYFQPWHQHWLDPNEPPLKKGGFDPSHEYGQRHQNRGMHNEGPYMMTDSLGPLPTGISKFMKKASDQSDNKLLGVVDSPSKFNHDNAYLSSIRGPLHTRYDNFDFPDKMGHDLPPVFSSHEDMLEWFYNHGKNPNILRLKSDEKQNNHSTQQQKSAGQKVTEKPNEDNTTENAA